MLQRVSDMSQLEEFDPAELPLTAVSAAEPGSLYLLSPFPFFRIYTINGITIILSPLYIHGLSISIIYLLPHSIFSIVFFFLKKNVKSLHLIYPLSPSPSLCFNLPGPYIQ